MPGRAVRDCRGPGPAARLGLVIFLLITAVVVLPTLANMLAQFRDDRRRFGGPPRLCRRPDAETVAFRSLLAGSIDRDQYQRAVAALAAQDEIAYPVRVPLG